MLLELLASMWKPEGEQHHGAAVARGVGGGGGGGGAVEGAAGGGGVCAVEAGGGVRSLLAHNLWASLHELASLFLSRAQNSVRFALFFTIVVVLMIIFMRPRRHPEFADLMVWMGEHRWERTELGVAGAHLDRWPLALRRGHERERCAPLRRVRSEAALCRRERLRLRLRKSRTI